MEQKRVVLLVEDDPTQLRVLAELFQSEYLVKIATCGAKAIEVAKKGVDIILLDLHLPDMDGLAVCAELKNNPLTNPIPIIFLTATQDLILEEKGIEMGAADFITKPYTGTILLARVRSNVHNKILRDQLEDLALTDSLTNIANRRNFIQTLTNEWGRHLRNQQSLALIMIDIDYFKKINDTYGHKVGDQALIWIAQICKNFCKRSSDFPARLGGEEFVLLLPETDLIGAQHLAEDLRQAVASSSIQVNNFTQLQLTISLGISSCIPNQSNCDDYLLLEADKQLYLSKELGRNQINPKIGPTQTTKTG